MKENIVETTKNGLNALIEKANKCDEYEKTQGSIERIRNQASRFYCKTFTADMVAKLHDVSKATVIKYVKLGLIPTHPSSTDGKILIRASDSIVLDFTELKHRSKYVR